MDTNDQVRDLSIPRGIRNNNPGNILFNPDNKWLGQTAPDKDGYCRFMIPTYGIRALCLDLKSLYVTHGHRTVKGLVTAWDGATDSSCAEYVSAVVQWLGLLGPESIISPEAMGHVIRCIIHFENGSMPYSDREIERALELALYA